ncbi:MAG TPA: hypothetical protein VFV75_02220 [Candidatus Polarisedimenticolaceae bacterium]|nr:hypothetical protein [Candidatus Polarisedimenticolaceae bacterium]
MLVPLLFFLSGAAALLLETVFLRQMTWLAGSAVTATSVVLAAFMAGLGLGALVVGRLADRVARPLALYGVLELSVALSGAGLVLLLAHGRDALLAPERALPGRAGDAATLGLAFLLLLLPTACMGGTLPALARHAIQERATVLAPVGLLYGINTLGGACGTLLGGLVLLERLGISATGLLGTGVAGVAGIAALALARGTRAPAAPSPGARVWRSADRRACLLATAVSGAAVLGYEVAWTRLLVLCLRSYAYSFSVMLALFLLGLVLGALLVRAAAARVGDPRTWLAGTLLGMGTWVAASLLWMPPLLVPPAEARSFGGFLLAAALRVAPVVLPPTILSGMALPLAAAALASPARAGREVGAVYAANTAGAIAGALGAGLALLPWLGAPRTLAALAAAQALAGALLLRQRPAALAIPALCACALLLPRGAFVRGFLQASRGGERAAEVLAFHEGATDTVAVVRKSYGFRDPDAKSILVNGIAMTATVQPVWRYMAAEGHLPALLAPDPGKALVLCVGTGITLGSLLATPGVAHVDAVDLSEGILRALPLFARENRRAFADPRVTLHRQDGRHFLETTGERYGLITLEPPPPIVAGSVHLYSLDFYRLCRRHLLPGGVVAQWLPLHGQSLGSARATARTFLEAFPHAQLWLPSIRDAVLLGSDRSLTLSPDRLAQAYATATGRASLEAATLETPEALLATYLLDRGGIARWCAGADLVTDDRPRLEFFRPYGPNMEDRDIATLLAVPAADPIPLPGFEHRVARETAAMRLYLRSEVEDDLGAAREAARISRGTRFFLYRFGCDPTQMENLRQESGGGPAFAAQARRCAELVREEW